MAGMTTCLAILIPTLLNRAPLYDRLVTALRKQIGGNDRVTILTNIDNSQMTIGAKRNSLIEHAAFAGAKYVAFFDDDDLPGPKYIQRQLEVCDSGLDCGELWGQIYFSGRVGMPFHHSIEHKKWWQDNKYYYRSPNHLNCIRTDLMMSCPFPDKSFGEDGVQSEAMAQSGLLKTMHPCADIIYHYFTGGNSQTELNYAKSLGV